MTHLTNSRDEDDEDDFDADDDEDSSLEGAEVVLRHEWDSGGPGAGAGTEAVYHVGFRYYASISEMGRLGPFDSIDQVLLEHPSLLMVTDASTEIEWIGQTVDYIASRLVIEEWPEGGIVVNGELVYEPPDSARWWEPEAEDDDEDDDEEDTSDHSALVNAYRSTTWTGVDPRFVFKFDGPLDLCEFFDAPTVAIVTASNPRSKLEDPEDNRARNLELEEALRRRRYLYARCEGLGGDNAWREDSFALIGIKRHRAVGLGFEYEQNTVVWAERGNRPCLLVTREGFAGRRLGDAICD